ncbi:MAG TPA: DUF4962 domain-containing protein [archaeon]|nr:DUF4962 domain-containing protein [archaeon]
MAARLLNFFLLLSCLILTSCSRPEPSPVKGQNRLEAVKNLHPRLILTVEKQKNLESVLETTHKWLWERYLQDLPGKVAAGKKPLTELPDRSHADLAPELCFAWLMLGEDSLFQTAKNQLLKLVQSDKWDPENDLVVGHLLQGMALAYDWLYQSLTPEERSLTAERLGREAELSYQRITVGRVWFRTQYLQNHAYTNFCGLAYAAVALYGEDPRAPVWLKVCEDFFDTMFRKLPVDGASIEGLSYGAYGLDYNLRYAELARDLLGKDYYDLPWFKGFSTYLIQSLLPRCTEDEWAMTFGDNPRQANWHGPEQQLFHLASLYHDTAAQWLGRFLVNLRPEGLGSANWWSLFWYDPSVGEADPAQFLTFKHFTDLEQVMMRSSWRDTSAMLVGLKCGPVMGKALSRDPLYDFGTGHNHPDAGSFQIFAFCQWLAVDPLYTGFKRTANHNTMLFKNQGQLGEEIQWFAAAEAVKFYHYPEILQAGSNPSYDYVVCNVAPAYHPALGLKRFTRHFLFIKPDILLVADQITLDKNGVLHTYPSESLATSGGLGHNDAGYVMGPEGEASTVFQGETGTYILTATYLDNYPGTGEYSFVVDSDPVYTWRNDEEVTDYHCVLSPEVKLKKGSTLAFRGHPMAKACRLLKITAYSDRVPASRQAQWLLHFDTETELVREPSHITATLGGAALDLYPLAPARSPLSWDTFKIIRAEIEPFTLRETKRLVISPVFTDSTTTMLNLMHARSVSGPKLEGVKSELAEGKARITWRLGGKPVSVILDLEKREPVLE